MRAYSDRKLHISNGETLTLKSARAVLTQLGKDTAPAKTLSITAGPKQRLIRIRADSEGISALTVNSVKGESWETTLFPGSNLIDFIVEPVPDEWYCENDTGNPPHPVSKGDSKCSLCGGKVIHGGK
jgi:hypothetical protein